MKVTSVRCVQYRLRILPEKDILAQKNGSISFLDPLYCCEELSSHFTDEPFKQLFRYLSGQLNCESDVVSLC